MKRILKLIFATIILTLSGVSAFAQGKVYTRKARIADFPTCTTKIVSSGDSFLDIAFRKEISTRWRISPYEFCTQSEYEKLKSNNSLYFLYIGVDKGVCFLVLEKGGMEDAENNLKRPFELVRIPICSQGMPSGRELLHIGAFLDILQAYTEDAMVSEQTAYSGLRRYNKSFSGKTVCFNQDKADTLFTEGAPDTLVAIYVCPEETGKDKRCYRMLISTDTHELYYYKEYPFRKGTEAQFSKREIDKIGKKNTVIE